MPILGSFGAAGAKAFGMTANSQLKFNVRYLVIGGGGSGGAQTDNSGGAGGYRTNEPGENSGGPSSAEAALEISTGVDYTLTVGAGAASPGPGPTPRPFATGGENSVFASITSTRGGSGGPYNPATSPQQPIKDGGSGVGSYGAPGIGEGTTGQGNDGGNNGGAVGPGFGCAGGGGAGQIGQGNPSQGGNAPGGAGISSDITNTGVQRGGGGGGGNRPQLPAGSGGVGGGGAGTNTHKSAATAGTANTGGGGGAEGYNNQPPGIPFAILSGAGAGGSGLVVLKVPTDVTASFSPGVTAQTITTVPSFNIYNITAASGSDTVSFSKA